MFQMFHLFQSYVVIVSSECCKVDLNVELFSEEERASAGVMAASAVSWRQHSIGGRAGFYAGARSPFPYDMLPPLEILEQKLVASPCTTEMQILTMEVMQA
jgi:hypothetical protein